MSNVFNDQVVFNNGTQTYGNSSVSGDLEVAGTIRGGFIELPPGEAFSLDETLRSGNTSGIGLSVGISTISSLQSTEISVGVATITTVAITTAYVTNLRGVGIGTSTQIPAGNKIIGISSGSIYAPGTILQTEFGSTTSQVVNTTTRTYQVIHSLTLTSINSNSRYFITGYAHGYSASAGARSNLGFSVTIGGVTTRIEGVDGANGDSWGTSATNGAQYNRSTVWTSTSPAGTIMTFNLLGAGYDFAPTWNLSTYGHKSTLTVMEIAV